MTDDVERPAEGAAPETQEDTKAETSKKEERQDGVTLIDDDDDEIVVGDEDDDEDDDDSDKDEAKPDDAKGEQPKKKSRSQRLREQVRRLRQENEQLRRPRNEDREPVYAADDDDDLVEPKESDFPNDYLAYDRALRAYETRKVIRDENKRTADRTADQRAQRAYEARIRAYNANLDTVRDRIPDFDQVMRDAGHLEIRDDVRDLVLESEKSGFLAYWLAKNPDRVAALNRMNPTEAAREIGRLEARIRGPKPKTVTKAKPPAETPKGTGGGKTKSIESMSMDEFVKHREAGGT